MASGTTLQKRHLWAFGAAFCALSFLITGYAIYWSNQAIQIPLVLLLNDPSLYPLDPFASTLPYYASMLWRIVALFNRIVPLEPLFFIFFMLERCLLMYASARLALAYAPGSTLPAIGTMAFFALVPQPFLAGGTIVMKYFEQTAFSIPFFLLSIASFYRNRPISMAIWLSIGFNLNSMYGAYTLTYLAAAFFASRPQRSTWQKWAMSTMLFVLLSSPALLLTARAFSIKSTDKNLWLMAAEIFVPYHLYPLTWGLKTFVVFGLFIFVTIVLMRICKRDSERLYKYSFIWTAVALFWLVCAFIAAYLAKSPSMLVAHPGRGADLWYCLVGSALICAYGVRVEQRVNPQRLYTVLFFIVILFRHSKYLLLLSPLLILLIWNPGWKTFLKKGDPARIASALVLMVLVVGGYLLQVRLKSNGTAFIFAPDKSVVDIAHWAKKNTDVRATFLVHLDWKEFRALSHRGVFVTWKDGSAILWYQRFVQEWSKRLFALGYDMRKAGSKSDLQDLDRYALHMALNDERVKNIKRQFPIHFWIVAVDHISSFPVVFHNEKYKVLDLN